VAASHSADAADRLLPDHHRACGLLISTTPTVLPRDDIANCNQAFSCGFTNQFVVPVIGLACFVAVSIGGSPPLTGSPPADYATACG
jgi:hypothetical protein